MENMENQPPTNGVRPRSAAPKHQQQANVVNGAAGNADNGYNADKEKSVVNESYLGPLHWIGIIIYVSAVYFLCIKLDGTLPAPLTAAQAGDRRFSEERARKHLNALADMGPRISGSDAAEIHARNYLLAEIEKIRSRMDEKQYRMDVDVQKPSGCFGLVFLSNFTLCYKNLTNIVVRLGRREAGDRPSSHSLLLNCHFDSVAQSPGATDDAISCAIMLELLNIFSRQDPKMLPYDLTFLFNGAEENFLQASHGFITTHPWRHSIRAFINLEGCGAGGREMLFQSGPANIWLMHAYLDSAPRPHCSIMAQEVFQSGLVPADTDFRILRDFGRMPGMDIAYTKNGYVYHTEFDRPEFVAPGAVQRGGENIFATAASIIRSPCFTKPCPQQETKLVYFDIVGQFVVQYPLTYGTLLNYAVVVMIVLRILRQMQQSSALSIKNDGYSAGEALSALGIHILAIVSMLVTAYAMTRLTILLDLTMAWYSRRPMVLVLYIVPTLVTGLMVHAAWNLYLTPRSPAANAHFSPFRLERVTFDMALLIFAGVLLGLTWKGLGSAYYALLHALFPLLREVLLGIYDLFLGNQRKSASVLLIAHTVVLFPVVVLTSYGTITMLEFFIPIMGRSGPVLNPEILVAVMGSACSLVVVLYMAGMVYLSRGFGEILKFASCLTILFIAVAALTDFGAPYVYSPEEPRLRRLHIQHVSRTIYAPNGQVNSSQNALFLAALDYRGARDLPPTAFLQGSGPPPCVREDAYCGLPYYVSVKDMFPPDRTLWMPVASAPAFEKPISIKLSSKEELSAGTVKMSFSITGYDHMTVFITPLNNWTLDSWSVTSELLGRGRTQTYFLYLAYAGRDVGPWEFSLTLKSSSQKPNQADEPRLLLGVASHYLHGKNQYTPQTKALIDNIRERRSKPPTATLGYWKWAMTPDGFSSEYVAKYF